MDTIALLKSRIRERIPKPAVLRAIAPSEWETLVPQMPDEALEYFHLSFAAETLEGIYYLPAILEYCVSQNEGFALLRKVLVFLSDPSTHAPFGTYTLLLRTLEGIFALRTSTFARNERELQYWDYGGPRILLSPVVGGGQRDSFLTDVCRRELSYRGEWFSELIFWIWSGDDMPERAAHLIDFLYHAVTSPGLIREECYREPAVVRLLLNEDFCRWRWFSIRDYFRSVVGDEYANEVQRVLIDERPGWMKRAANLKIRDSEPRCYDRYYHQDPEQVQETPPMPSSENGSAYLEVIRTRDEAFERVRTLNNNASACLYLMKDRESQGLRAFGISEKDAAEPSFPQGPAIFDVAKWPSGEELKQAYDDLNAGNEAVFAAWELLSDEERNVLPQPNVLRPTRRR